MLRRRRPRRPKQRKLTSPLILIVCPGLRGAPPSLVLGYGKSYFRFLPSSVVNVLVNVAGGVGPERASTSGTLTSTTRSSPSRLNVSCGFSSTMKTISCEPPAVSCPAPLKRILVPAFHPGLMLTETEREGQHEREVKGLKKPEDVLSRVLASSPPARRFLVTRNFLVAPL